MKTIVISGASSNVGKTTLAKEIRDILPNTVFAKIGHGKEKENRDNFFYHLGTPFEQIMNNHGNADYLIIESNSILKEIQPDLTIYLDGTRNPGWVESTCQRQARRARSRMRSVKAGKVSAPFAKSRADIISNMLVDQSKIKSLTTQLNIEASIVRQLIWLAGARPEPATAVIMAGGKSSRMGTNKALLRINGESAVERLHHILSPLFDKIIVSVAEENEPPIPGVKIVADIEKNKGPLMGIYSSLSASSNRVNFVIACDIPDIDVNLLRRLLSYSETYDIVVPSFQKGQSEPLFAVYAKKVMDGAKDLLANNKLRIAELYSLYRTKIIETSEKNWYTNLNTQEDYENYTRKIETVER